MYLPDNEIKSLIDNDVLYNAKLENVQQVSYDLTIAEFHDKGMRCDTVDVKPGNSIFVSTEEKICLPKNLVAQVSLRNSWIRKGLLLDSPVYFPGHNTHIYFRITNLAGETVKLKKADGLAQIYFLQIKGNVSNDYIGDFSDEANAAVIGDMDVFQADEKRMKKAVKPIKSLEQHIYVNVLALLAIFVGISTISQSALKLDSKASLIGATLVQCASFSVLFLLITLLMPNKKKPWVYLIPMVIAIACIFFLLKHEAWEMGPLFIWTSFPSDWSSVMTIYIAARYNEKERNEKIALALRKQGFSSILPRKFRMRSDTREKSKSVYKECLKALDRSSTILVVSPFGRDVAFEIGYYQHLRESLSTDPTRTMHIVRFNTDTTRAIQDDMISNVIDYESDDFKEICNYLSRYETKTFPIPKKKRNYKKKFRSDAELRIS